MPFTKGGPNPGFAKGQSGNAGGRAKGLAAKARELGPKALTVIEEALADDNPSVRIAAAKEVFDRGWGKAVALSADVTNRLDEFTDDDIDTAISALRDARHAAVDAGTGTGASTKH